MFSGVIAYRGRIVAAENDRGGMALRVACEGVAAENPEPKDSIAIDGVCLTATGIEDDVVAFDVVPETVSRTTLGDRAPGDVVNVEYALRVGDRAGGQFVYGHVDTTARVLSLVDEGQGKRMRVERPKAIAAGIAEKGFVAVDGVSLTVATLGNDWFEIALVPETLARTTLGVRAQGDLVNLELDPIARYALAALTAR